MGSLEPKWTDHAGRMVIKRHLDAQKVLAIAADAMAAGFGASGEPTRYQHGNIRVVIAKNVIITAYRVNASRKTRARRNQRRRR